MGQIYLPVKSLQAVSNINLFANVLEEKPFFLQVFILPLVGTSVCEDPACVRLGGRVGQIYLRSGKYLNKHLVKQCKYKMGTQIQLHKYKTKYI